jgi:hypothetical protein
MKQKYKSSEHLHYGIDHFQDLIFKLSY